jgi:CRISPR-associated protein Cmr4
MNTEPKSEIRNQKSKLLCLFTRTPLHVGAGASVGAIDQPIIRERHTGFPVIPASSLKGTFADAWSDGLLEEQNDKGETKKVRVRKDGTASEAAWLFGSDSDKYAAAGALQFSEARLLALPIRSAKGSFAWITCPLILQRAVRDGVFDGGADEFKQARATVPSLSEPDDEQALFSTAPLGLELNKNGQTTTQVVLEEYTFTRTGGDEAARIGKALAKLLLDPVWNEVASRLVILSNGMMSFFAQNACEVAQHVRINDETGTAAGGALFNQENVPSETMFYSVLHAFDERTANKPAAQRRQADEAIKAFQGQDKDGTDDDSKPGVRDGSVFQFGGDASTGLGYCTVQLAAPAQPS